jgi:hypothetical protein
MHLDCEAVELDPGYVKAYLRRATARRAKGGLSDLIGAKEGRAFFPELVSAFHPVL